MTHERKTIRDNVTTLLTGLSTTGSNVYADQVYPLEADTLPALRIYIGAEERSEDQGMGDPVVSEFDLIIEIVTAKASGISDQIDSIIEEVQDKIATDPTLSDALVADGLRWESTERTEFSTEGEKEHGLTELAYSGKYEVSL